MADFQGKSPRGAKNPKMEPFSIWLKFYTKTYFSAGNPLKIVPMADFQAKSSRGAKSEKNGAILDLAKILHQDKFECGESIKHSPDD